MGRGAEETVTTKLSPVALSLGVAGLAPQVLALLATFSEADRFVGLAAGYFYAALIFSFLGGIWWGVAVARKESPRWLYGVAVAPSLIAFFSGIPWMTGGDWPGPSLVVLGIGLLASPVVDYRLGRLDLIQSDFLRLRIALSIGLGTLTLILALRSF